MPQMRWLQALTLMLVLTTPMTAVATTYGNLARKWVPGRLEVGLLASQTQRDLDAKISIDTSIGSAEVTDTFSVDINRQSVQVSLGLSEQAGLAGQVGNLELKDEDGDKISGQEFAGMLRFHFPGSQTGFDSGIILSGRTASVANKYWEGRVKQMDLGFGGGKAISDGGALYFSLIYSKVTATLDATPRLMQSAAGELSDYYGAPVTVSSLKEEFSEASTFLLVLGGEFQMAANATVALDLHAMGENGFALGVFFGF